MHTIYMSRLLFLHAATNLRPTPPQKEGGVDVHMPCMLHSHVLGSMEVHGH